jgi:hypothetical protein
MSPSCTLTSIAGTVTTHPERLPEDLAWLEYELGFWRRRMAEASDERYRSLYGDKVRAVLLRKEALLRLQVELARRQGKAAS